MVNKSNRPSEMSEEYELLKEIAQKKRNDNEPRRWEYVLKVLREKGYTPVEDPENKCIRFSFNGNTVTVWPYSGCFYGRGVKDGRGIKKLIKQI